MDPRIAELSRRLAASHRDLEGAVASVPAELRGRAPAADRWSVAHVLEHLAIVEASLNRAIEALIAEARPRDDAEHFDAVAFTQHVDMPGLLDRSRPRTASPASQPPGALDADAAARLLAERRDALLRTLTGGAGRRLEAVTRPHAALGALTGYQWISFVAYHESRHAAQIREVGEQLAGRA